jgi:tRNA wybutosine-synthesizing protein 1
MEMDCILRPGGWVIFCDEVELLIKVEDIVKFMHWDIMFTYKINNNSEHLLAVQKSFWRPDPSNL